MRSGLDENTDAIIHKISVVFREERVHPWKHGPCRNIMPEHSYTLLYVQQGCYCHSVEGREPQFIPSGSMILKKYDGKMYCNTSIELPYHYLAADIHTLEEIPIDFSRSNYFVLSGDSVPQCEEKMIAMLRLYTERPFGWKPRMRGIAEELLLAILEAYYEEKCDAFPPLIEESTAVIRRRIFSEVLSVEDVARECGVTPAHLIRSFRRYLGMTPKHYMNSLRVEMACDLLKYTGKSMEEVAERSGFSETRQLRRVFSEIMGISPREYRGQQ